MQYIKGYLQNSALAKFQNLPVFVQFRGNRRSVNIIAQVIKCYKFCAIFAMRYLVECGNCENTGNSENDPRVYELLCRKQSINKELIKRE